MASGDAIITAQSTVQTWADQAAASPTLTRLNTAAGEIASRLSSGDVVVDQYRTSLLLMLACFIMLALVLISKQRQSVPEMSVLEDGIDDLNRNLRETQKKLDLMLVDRKSQFEYLKQDLNHLHSELEILSDQIQILSEPAQQFTNARGTNHGLEGSAARVRIR